MEILLSEEENAGVLGWKAETSCLRGNHSYSNFTFFISFQGILTFEKQMEAAEMTHPDLHEEIALLLHHEAR